MRGVPLESHTSPPKVLSAGKVVGGAVRGKSATLTPLRVPVNVRFPPIVALPVTAIVVLNVAAPATLSVDSKATALSLSGTLSDSAESAIDAAGSVIEPVT